MFLQMSGCSRFQAAMTATWLIFNYTAIITEHNPTVHQPVSLLPLEILYSSSVH